MKLIWLLGALVLVGCVHPRVSSTLYTNKDEVQLLGLLGTVQSYLPNYTEDTHLARFEQSQIDAVLAALKAVPDPITAQNAHASYERLNNAWNALVAEDNLLHTTSII